MLACSKRYYSVYKTMSTTNNFATHILPTLPLSKPPSECRAKKGFLGNDTVTRKMAIPCVVVQLVFALCFLTILCGLKDGSDSYWHYSNKFFHWLSRSGKLSSKSGSCFLPSHQILISTSTLYCGIYFIRQFYRKKDDKRTHCW